MKSLAGQGKVKCTTAPSPIGLLSAPKAFMIRTIRPQVSPGGTVVFYFLFEVAREAAE